MNLTPTFFLNITILVGAYNGSVPSKNANGNDITVAKLHLSSMSALFMKPGIHFVEISCLSSLGRDSIIDELIPSSIFV